MYYFVIRLGGSCSLRQSLGVGTVISPSAIATMSNCFIRVLLAISIAVYNTCRPCIGCFVYRRPINIYSVILYPCSSGPAVIINPINRDAPVGHALYIFSARPGNIGPVIINISIVNNSCITYNGYRPAPWYIIVVHNRAVNIGLWCTYPIIIRYTVAAAYGNTYANARQ